MEITDTKEETSNAGAMVLNGAEILLKDSSGENHAYSRAARSVLPDIDLSSTKCDADSAKERARLELKDRSIVSAGGIYGVNDYLLQNFDKIYPQEQYPDELRRGLLNDFHNAMKDFRAISKEDEGDPRQMDRNKTLFNLGCKIGRNGMKLEYFDSLEKTGNEQADKNRRESLSIEIEQAKKLVEKIRRKNNC